jgi:hypothetical protein
MKKYKKNIIKDKDEKNMAIEERKRKLFSAKSIGTLNRK